MDILAELQTFKDSHAKLEADLSAATALAEQAAAQLADKEKALADSQALEASQQETIAHLNAELESIKQSLATFKAEAKTAEQLAIELVASQGIAPIKIDVDASADALTAQGAKTTYKELLRTNSKAAGAYYTKHKALILQ